MQSLEQTAITPSPAWPTLAATIQDQEGGKMHEKLELHVMEAGSQALEQTIHTIVLTRVTPWEIWSDPTCTRLGAPVQRVVRVPAKTGAVFSFSPSGPTDRNPSSCSSTVLCITFQVNFKVNLGNEFWVTLEAGHEEWGDVWAQRGG